MGTKRARINVRGVETDYTLFFRKVSPFSNHHPVDFYCDEAINIKEPKLFSCNEQFYMFNKASLFQNVPVMAEILKSDNPKEMKKLAGKENISNWDEKLWNQYKDDVMKKGTLAKFQQAAHLRYILFLSHGSQCVECSPFDRYWGIGKDLESAESFLSLGYGLGGGNRLGKILDEVRELLWNDESYRDEREYVERRISEDSEFLMKAMKKIDLIYKDRAKRRFAKYRRYSHSVQHSETDSEGVELIPEWARPPSLDEEKYRICPSPAVLTNFDENLAPNGDGATRATAYGEFKGDLAKRLSFPGGERERERPRREDNRRSLYEPLRSYEIRRSRSRGESRNKKRERRSRSASSSSRSSDSRRSSRSRSRDRDRDRSRSRNRNRRKSRSRSRSRDRNRKRDRKSRRSSSSSSDSRSEDSGSRRRKSDRDRKRKRSKSRGYDNDRKRRRTDDRRSSHRRRSDRSSSVSNRNRGNNDEKKAVMNRKERRAAERKAQESVIKPRERDPSSNERDIDNILQETGAVDPLPLPTTSELKISPEKPPVREVSVESSNSSEDSRKKRKRQDIVIYIPGKKNGRMDLNLLREKYIKNKEKSKNK